MTAEFNWWLLMLGLVVGGGLAWLVLAETRRRERDLEDDELADEALWLEARLAEEGRDVPPEMIERIVRLHRAYLEIEPPDDVPDDWPVEGIPVDVPDATEREPSHEARPAAQPGDKGDAAVAESWRPPSA